MRKLSGSLLVACVLALLSVGILADDNDKMIKEHVEFSNDVLIGNTMVKKGFYLIKYNAETGMMKVVDEGEGNKVIATAKATMKVHDKSFDKDEIVTREISGRSILTALRLGGQKEELTISEQSASVDKN